MQIKLNSKEQKHKMRRLKIERWNIEIPAIGLYANIKDGVGMDILNKYVGHFKDTAYKEGNICLAAHNRGYEKNYFAKLHTLNIGEKIIYNIGNNKYYYSVVSFKEVSEDDVSCLYDNPEDVLILITCIKDKPTKRLVVTCKKINS